MPAVRKPLRVVIAGGGVGGLECALALADLAGDRVVATVVDPSDAYVERAWAVADAFDGTVRAGLPLDDVLAGTRTARRRDAVVAVDLPGHAVALASGGRLAYDALVVAVGAERCPVPPAAIALDPDDLGPLRELASEVAAGAVRRVAVVVPPGRHWTLPAYELALLLADRARGAPAPSTGRPAADIVVVAPEPLPLSIFGAGAHDALRAELDAAGVRLMGGTAAEIHGRLHPRLLLHPGHLAMNVDRVVALPALRPRPLTGLNGGGFLPTGRDGRVNGTRDVYAIGDATEEPVKLGSLAADHAEVVAHALARRAGAHVPAPPPRRGPRGLLLTPTRFHRLPLDATAEAPATTTTALADRPAAGAGAPASLPAAKVDAPRLAARLDALERGR